MTVLVKTDPPNHTNTAGSLRPETENADSGSSDKSPRISNNYRNADYNKALLRPEDVTQW